MGEDPVERLYGLPLERFVPERDALARRLRSERRRELAATVARLAKPSRPAWIVNQLARAEPALTAQLIACGEALAAAQAAAVTGDGAGALRSAAHAERAAVDRLLACARALEPSGRAATAATLERVRTTLHAVAGDERLGVTVRAGRLVEEPAPGGTWPLAAAQADEPGRKRPVHAATSAEGKLRRPGPGQPATSAGAEPKRPRAQTATDDHEAAAARRALRAAKEREARAAAEQEAAERRQELEARRRTARRVARETKTAHELAERAATRAAARVERLSSELEEARDGAEAAADGRAATARAAAEAAAQLAQVERELRSLSPPPLRPARPRARPRRAR